MSNKPIKFIRSTDKMVLGENYFPDKYKYVVNDAYLDAKEKGTIKPNNHVENYEEKKEDKKSEDKKLEEKKKEQEKIKSFYGNDTNIKEKDGKQIIELSDDGFWIPGINMEKDKEYEFYNKEKNQTYNISNNINKDIRENYLKVLRGEVKPNLSDSLLYGKQNIAIASITDFINDKYGRVVDEEFVKSIIQNMDKEFHGKGKTEKDHYRKKAYDIFDKVKVSDDKFNLTGEQNKKISLLKSTIGMTDPVSYLKDKGININKSKYNILIKSIKSGDNVKIKNTLDYHLK